MHLLHELKSRMDVDAISAVRMFCMKAVFKCCLNWTRLEGRGCHLADTTCTIAVHLHIRYLIKVRVWSNNHVATDASQRSAHLHLFMTVMAFFPKSRCNQWPSYPWPTHTHTHTQLLTYSGEFLSVQLWKKLVTFMRVRCDECPCLGTHCPLTAACCRLQQDPGPHCRLCRLCRLLQDPGPLWNEITFKAGPK